MTQYVACVKFNLSEMPSTETTHRAELHLHVELDADNETSTTLAAVYRATRPLAGHRCRLDDSAVRAGHMRLVGRRTAAERRRRRRDTDGRWTTHVVSSAVRLWRRRPEKLSLIHISEPTRPY